MRRWRAPRLYVFFFGFLSLPPELNQPLIRTPTDLETGQIRPHTKQQPLCVLAAAAPNLVLVRTYIYSIPHTEVVIVQASICKAPL